MEPRASVSTLPTLPAAVSELGLRTGLASHFLRALTGWRDPPDEECEQGLELPERWRGTEPTAGGTLASLAATDQDSAERAQRRRAAGLENSNYGAHPLGSDTADTAQTFASISCAEPSLCG